MNTIILGLGNTILTDDGVGIYVARRVEMLLQRTGVQHVTVVEAGAGGFRLIDLLSGFERAAIIDAIHTKDSVPGKFYELDINALRTSARLSTIHQIDFATACALAKDMGVEFPSEITIFVMQVADEFSFGENPTPNVKEAIPKMAKAIVATLKGRCWF